MMARHSRLVVSATMLVALLVALEGCGGGGGGGGGGGSATAANATISGNVSNQSTALHMTAPVTMFARVLDFFSPVREALAARTGIRVEVNGIVTETDQNGFFAITGPFSGVVTVRFGSGNRTFTLQVDVPPGGTVVLRDVDLRDNDTAHPGRTDVKVRGTIAGVDCGADPQTLSIDLAGQIITFALDASTRIKITGGNSDAACEDLEGVIGARVRVEAEQLADDTLLADKVKVHDEDDDDEDEVEFEGTVVATDCPDSITVERTDGQTVVVSLTGTTELEDILDCADLAGRRVEVEGVVVNGIFVATEIEAEDDDDDDEDDDDEDDEDDDDDDEDEDDEDDDDDD